MASPGKGQGHPLRFPAEHREHKSSVAGAVGALVWSEGEAVIDSLRDRVTLRGRKSGSACPGTRSLQA